MKMENNTKIKKKVHLSIIKRPHYPCPNAPEFKRKYPDYKQYNSAIYLNDYRICGPKDYYGQIIFDTERIGIVGIETVAILKALNIPDHIIKQLDFEQ